MIPCLHRHTTLNTAEITLQPCHFAALPPRHQPTTLKASKRFTRLFGHWGLWHCAIMPLWHYPTTPPRTKATLPLWYSAFCRGIALQSCHCLKILKVALPLRRHATPPPCHYAAATLETLKVTPPNSDRIVPCGAGGDAGLELPTVWYHTVLAATLIVRLGSHAPEIVEKFVGSYERRPTSSPWPISMAWVPRP